MRSVRELYDFQLLDWEIQELEEELSRIRATLADDSRRQNAHRRLFALQRKLDELRAPRRAAQDEIEQIEQRAARIDERMYSGAVTNPRELEAYQDERAMLARNHGIEEDRLLELMVESEDTQKLRDEAQVVFDRIHEERSEEVTELGSRGRQLTLELPTLQQRRATMSAEFSPQVLAVYETVRRSRGGQGAALVDQRGLCQGCRLIVPNSELQHVRSSEDVVQCGSCARILIYG